MAMRFRMIIHQNSENLHLRLEGDFDGSSANELLNVLVERCRFSSTAFIHTSGLRKVDPFGLCVFHINLKRLNEGIGFPVLHFTGDHALELAPE